MVVFSLMVSGWVPVSLWHDRKGKGGRKGEHTFGNPSDASAREWGGAKGWAPFADDHLACHLG